MLCSGLLACLLVSGTAHAAPAAPRGKAALTKNPLYRTGTFDLTECKELDRQRDDAESARIYLDHLLDCLNASWAEEFKQAKLRFSKPRVRYITKRVATGCGKYPAYAAGLYCSANKTMWIMLNKEVLADPTALWLFNVISHEYAHHVQMISGILPTVIRTKHRSRKAELLTVRRIELQAECWSGAFIGSVWHSLGRREFDWKHLLDSKIGDPLHGKTKSIRYWLNRGWYGNGPGVCNTWTVSPAKVA